MSETESRDAFCVLTEQYLSRAIALASYCSAESQRVEKTSPLPPQRGYPHRERPLGRCDGIVPHIKAASGLTRCSPPVRTLSLYGQRVLTGVSAGNTSLHSTVRAILQGASVLLRLLFLKSRYAIAVLNSDPGAVRGYSHEVRVTEVSHHTGREVEAGRAAGTHVFYCQSPQGWCNRSTAVPWETAFETHADLL